MSRQVALFGGSFDPAHLGHVLVVARVLATEDVDEVWLVPTHTHAFGKPLTEFAVRVEMAEAIAGLFDERVQVSRVEGEIARDGENRTVDTLEHLAAAHPDTRFALVIGTDVLAELDQWYEPERVRELARLIVVNRMGYEREGYGPALPEVSSTWIRERLRAGGSVEGWVSREVLAICERERLYR